MTVLVHKQTVQSQLVRQVSLACHKDVQPQPDGSSYVHARVHARVGAANMQGASSVRHKFHTASHTHGTLSVAPQNYRGAVGIKCDTTVTHGSC